MLENSILLLPLICCMEVGNILDTPSNLSLKILKEIFKFNSNYLMNILMSLDVLHRNSNIGVSQNFPDPCIKDKKIYQEHFCECRESRGGAQAVTGLHRGLKSFSRAVFLLRRLKQDVSDQHLVSMYYGLFCSHLNYGLQLLGHAPYLRRLFLLQKRAIRILKSSK